MPAAIVQLTAETSLGGGANKAVNVYHIATNGLVTSTELTNLITCFKTFYQQFLPYAPPTSTWTIGQKVTYWEQGWWVPVSPVGAQPGDPGYVAAHFDVGKAPLILTAVQQTAGPGTGIGNLPYQLASVVSWRTAVASRNTRGRTYLGPFATNATAGQFLNNSMTAAMATAANTLITAVSAVSIATGFGSLCVWSPTKGFAFPITGAAVDITPDTLRSRVR